MSDMSVCPHCGQSHPAEADFCPVTGATLRVEKTCPRCHRRVQPEWLACPHCGQRLDKQSRQKAAVAALPPEEQGKVRAQRKRRRRALAVSVPGLLFFGVAVFLAWLLAAGRDSPIAHWVAANAPAQIASLVVTPVPTSTPTPRATLTPTSAPTLVSEEDGMVPVYVPAGEFLMGSTEFDEQAFDDEKPQRTVYLDAFWIDRTEVTNGMYKRCVAAGACQPPSPYGSYSRSSYFDDAEFGSYPVIHVSWHDAETYCAWAGRRLPTEAEWEKAARGTDGRLYPWGDSPPDASLLNFEMNVGDVVEVGSYPAGASPYGALDMAGNVWEWVADWYDGQYYAVAPSENPTGPASGESRVLRGGSWGYAAQFVRAAGRYGGNPDGRSYHLGFRCAR